MDISQEWGSDISLTLTGGIVLSEGLNLTRQRLVRRLFTNPGEYVWQPSYGAGLGRFIGTPKNKSAIVAVIRQQAEQEETVTKVVSVDIVYQGITALVITIVYQCNASATEQVLSFSVSPAGMQVI